jgi:hypothetical protein
VQYKPVGEQVVVLMGPCRVGKTSRASNERLVGMLCEIIVQLPDGVKNNLPKHT